MNNFCRDAKCRVAMLRVSMPYENCQRTIIFRENTEGSYSNIIQNQQDQ